MRPQHVDVGHWEAVAARDEGHQASTTGYGRGERSVCAACCALSLCSSGGRSMGCARGVRGVLEIGFSIRRAVCHGTPQANFSPFPKRKKIAQVRRSP